MLEDRGGVDWKKLEKINYVFFYFFYFGVATTLNKAWGFLASWKYWYTYTLDYSGWLLIIKLKHR